MANPAAFIAKRLRLFVQIIWTVASNGYLKGFSEGKIFTGDLKAFCLPGLNCYSCPGALGSCPIGSLQAVLASRGYIFSFYITGFFMIIGGILGRFVCGWLCPFGLVQDLLFKIPFIKKIRRIKYDRILRSVKYVILAVFVILLPLFILDITGQGQPWFCKLICPAGTLMGGIPLVAANEGLRSAIGWLFAWKSLILAAVVIMSIIIYRPFCRYICPLGAIYGLFNPISLYHLNINTAACTKCGKCTKACDLDISVYEKPNSPECIRCGKCIKICPHHAVSAGFFADAQDCVGKGASFPRSD